MTVISMSVSLHEVVFLCFMIVTSVTVSSHDVIFHDDSLHNVSCHEVIFHEVITMNVSSHVTFHDGGHHEHKLS